MQQEYQRNYFETLFSTAVLVVVFSFLPAPAHGAVIPQKVVLQSQEFVQVADAAQVSTWYTTDNRVVLSEKGFPEIENPRYCPYPALACQAFVPRAFLKHLAVVRVPVLDETKVHDYLQTIADNVSLDPQNAKLSQVDGVIQVTQEAVPGRTLDVEKTLTNLKKRLAENTETTVTLPVAIDTTAPKISSATLATLGVKEVVSVGETDFAGSPKNRIYNIRRAIEQYDGLAIAPGEEFSFVKNLGDVDGEHGYLPELVIKNNQTTPEFGGGICQVSTTVFRAALNAGFKITARKNHAYPVRYYKPYGMDATVYIPNPDLRFVNNTPGYIIMFPEIVGTKLRFTFYGTQDGRTVTFDGPHILESNPDGSMRTIFTQIVKDASGNTLINDSFPSNYKSPSLFPHTTEETTVFTSKPAGWSQKQWQQYKALH